ncbi:MAG: mismatch endonuclease, patch repair protein [Blastocatellia bacterium]|jgi:DNA mismatch endonuclease (patch repair protein)|nr:mismatch endonuclease, patch repair protein [Blastocatellia bacterium]
MESSELRSRTMRAVKSKDTSPELFVRRILHAKGYRYRLHRSNLPGCPDIVFPGRKSAILVHGCFWHGHDCARGARVPKTHTVYWTAKISRNVARDIEHLKALSQLGWKVLTVWECELKNESALTKRLIRFLK